MNGVDKLKGKFLARQVKAMQWVKCKVELIHNQRGAEAIEWLALVAVVVAILFIVMQSKGTIAEAIVEKIKGFIEGIKVG